MNPIRNTIAFLALLAALPGTIAYGEDYQLDDQHTSIVFAANHFSISDTYGMFGKYAGKFTLDIANPQTATFQFVIDAASLDTKSAKRDEHLQGPDFFDVKQFPTISFVSTSVTAGKDAKSFNVTGNLTLHGVTKEIVIPMTNTGAGKDPYGNERIGLAARFSLKRSEFGMGAMVPQVGDNVGILMSIEGIKQ